MKASCVILIMLFSVALYKPAEAQGRGCTDPLAVNYNPTANINDGSCIYNPAKTEPVSSFILDEILYETSGLLFWDGHLWTHNDNLDTNIYCLDTLNGLITEAYPLRGIINEDWEEISQDRDNIYIGDIGNNSGNRENLKIIKVSKISLLNRNPLIDSINYSYSDQTDFISPGGYNTDFDCEAFIVSDDSIYLFTKQWVSNQTSLYSLPKTPGKYIAVKKATFNVGGMITGAVYNEKKGVVVLSGYTKMLNPFLFLLYDFTDHDFFTGNKRKIELKLPFHQVEGITTSDFIKFYITNEYFSPNIFIAINQKLQILDLKPFLGNYLDLPDPHPDEVNNFIVSPVPAHDYLKVKSLPGRLPARYDLITISGKTVMTGLLTEENSILNIAPLNPGIYFLLVGNDKRSTFKIIKD